MAEIETLGILDEIQSLVSDKLQVVSYKWLSKNFLLSSDAAKRLLQKFVEKHGNDVEVVYSLSGWLKNNPSAHHVELVSSPKLAEVKQELYENCSVQVYSVQACIPKDAATLWNAEFVQSQELFTQPLSVNNGFWDNRFSRVLNSCVKRNVDGSSVSTDVSQEKTSGAPVTSKSKLTSQSVTMITPSSRTVQQAEPRANVHSPSIDNDVKKDISVPEGTKIEMDKEKAAQPHENKKKTRTDKTSAGNGGALANLWGRATSMSKADRISKETDIAIPNPAEAQVCAREELEDGNYLDDGEDVNIKSSNGRGNRKRRVILYSSDEEEEEDAVNLSSPDPPKTKTSTVLKPCSNIPGLEKTLHFEKNEKSDEKLMGEFVATEYKNHIAVPEISGHNPSIDEITSAKISDPTPKPPQRKKVLKKRIDERGREVTEVVWEDEETKPDSGLTKKAENKVAIEAAERPPPAKKPHVMGNSAPSAQAAKAGNKKAANKDPKQGKISSFFKKAS